MDHQQANINVNELILVVGGYGQVGQIVSRHIQNSLAGKLLIGGRQLSKAQALANKWGGTGGSIGHHRQRIGEHSR